jgi:PmbA protein
VNFREIVQTVMRASPAQQTEVVVVDQDENLTRFANNYIHQNVAERNTQITVRAVVGKRIGLAASNDMRRESLERLALRAFEIAKLQPENPEFKGLPRPVPITSICAFDSATAECSPADRAARLSVICRQAGSVGCMAAGSMTTSKFHLGAANSEGVFAEFRGTIADVSTVIMGPNSSGWAQASDWRVNMIDTEALAVEALFKVQLGRDPQDFAPGDYPVILDSYAAADILEMLAFDGMGALAVQEERSWLNARIGQKIMADMVTIIDDGLDLRGLPFPFDFEGVPKKAVPIIDSGIAMGPVYDSFTAGRETERKSTGHATPPSPSDRYGPLPMNLFLRPGTMPLEEMIRKTDFGVYITRFWYTRQVHPRDAVITGMTRDGTFVIRGGEIAQPVKSLRFTQSYVEALKHAEAIGPQPKLLKSGFGATSVPPLKLSSFRFTSATR